MERLLVKKFVRFLEESSDDVLIARRTLCEQQLNNPNIKSKETITDLHLCIRLIDEESSARLQVFGMDRKQL